MTSDTGSLGFAPEGSGAEDAEGAEGAQAGSWCRSRPSSAA